MPRAEFEVINQEGSVVQAQGTVGLSAVSLPSVAGNVLAYVFIRCTNDNPSSKYLEYSLDGGTTYNKLESGEFIGWPMRGNVQQIQIKGNDASVEYEFIGNLEDYEP